MAVKIKNRMTCHKCSKSIRVKLHIIGNEVQSQRVSQVRVNQQDQP